MINVELLRWFIPLVVTVLVILVESGYGATGRRTKRDNACSQADIIFVLDSSGSIGIDHWPQTLTFVKQVVAHFPVGPTATQFGSVTFGNEASIDFYLNTYKDAQSISDKVDQIKYKDENTNTSGGIWKMKDLMFTAANGDRPAAPNICILITDGASTRDHEKTIPYANLAKLQGITMIVIGVGSAVLQAELDAMASVMNGKKLVYTVQNYDSLAAIKEQIAQAACDIHADCQHMADVAFVLDSSSNIQSQNFDKTKTFIKHMLDNLNVASGQSNVAMVTYSDQAKVEFGLNDYHGRDDIKAAIDRVQYGKGSSNMADALRVLRDQVFTQANTGGGNRGDKTSIGIIFTNRGSNNMTATLAQAMLTRAAGISLLTVGVRSWLNEHEIQEVASDPDYYHAMMVNSYDDLQTLTASLQDLLCQGALYACTPSPCLNGGTCKAIINNFYCLCTDGYAGSVCQFPCAPADIALAIDTTNIPGAKVFYNSVVNFTKTFAMSLTLSQSLSQRLAVETISVSPVVQFYLGKYTNRAEAVSAICPIYDASFTRNTHLSLMSINDDIFSGIRGSRPYDMLAVRHIAVLLTYGGSADPNKTRDHWARSHALNNTVIVVAVNAKSEATQRELRGIASDPNQFNLINVDSFAQLGDTSILDRLTKSVCNTVNECISSPCQSGGTCRDDINGYTCRCQQGRIGVNCERSCAGDGRLDIVIAIDGSGSIRENRFPQILAYMQSIVNQFEIGFDRVKVGVVTFADTPLVRFNLNRFLRKEDILQAIDAIDYTRGKTNIADTLNVIRTQLFTPSNGARPDVPHVVLLFSDGVATLQQDRTIPEAILTKNANIQIQSIIVSPDPPTLDTKNMVSFDWQSNTFQMKSFNEMSSFNAAVFPRMLCDDVNECTSSPCQNGGQCINTIGSYYCVCTGRYTGPTCARDCGRSADVVFVLDSSGSLEHSFMLAQNFARGIIQNLNFVNGQTRIGALLYSDQSRIAFHLKDSPTDRQSAMNSIAFALMEGRTNTAGAVNTATTSMFTAVNGDRPSARNLMVVITDGNSNVNPQDTIPAAIRAQQAGIMVVAIGVQDVDGLNMAEVKNMAFNSSSTSRYSFQVNDLTQPIDTIVNSIADIVCQEF